MPAGYQQIVYFDFAQLAAPTESCRRVDRRSVILIPKILEPGRAGRVAKAFVRERQAVVNDSDNRPAGRRGAYFT